MEQSEPVTPDTSCEINGTTNHRKSGRARQKPVLLNKDPNVVQPTSRSSAKRKLADRSDVDGDDEDDDDIDELNDTGSEEPTSPDESDPDEEELKEKRRKTPRAKKPPSKSAPKKQKTAKSVPDLTTNLAVRPAAKRAKVPARSQKARTTPVTNATIEGTGLYGLLLFAIRFSRLTVA